MKVNLFLVESPFQALCALEASLRNKNSYNIVVYKLSEINGREQNNQQIKSIISYGQWHARHEFKAITKFGRISAHYSIRILLNWLRKTYVNKIDQLFIGEFRSKWMHQARLAINPKMTWLIDDGAASIKALNSYLKQGIFVYQDVSAEKNALKKLIWQIIYGRYEKNLFTLKNKPINAFSAFLGEQRIAKHCVNGIEIKLVKNDFSNVKTLLLKSASCDSAALKEVYYYGSKYSEAGIISFDYEIRFLNKVKEYYALRNLDVKYFSHRDESEDKLTKIERIFPGRVIRDTDMAELHLLKMHDRPAEIAAAYSSILVSLNIIFPEIKITSFKICSANIQPKFVSDIENAYAFYKEQGISISSAFMINSKLT